MEAAVLSLFAAVPLLSLVGHAGAFLADPGSELPVKLWGHEWFLENAFFGGWVPVLAWPNPGPLNNPDLLGTLVTGALRPLLGRARAYDALVFLQVFANLWAGHRLAAELVDRASAYVAAVAFALAPLVLTYCVAGAITDVLVLWPWALAYRHGLRVLRAEAPLRDGLLAGAWGAFGLWACAYNAVIFAAAAVPALGFLPTLWRTVPRRALVTGTLAALFVAGAGAASQALWTRRLVEAPGAQVGTTLLTETRHQPPFPYLRPEHRDRYVVRLTDYVAVGKGAVIEREAGSRYLRAYAPGFLLLALAALGASRRREARVALVFAAFFALASAGPFLAISGTVSLSTPHNPVFLALWHGVPGTKLLLEPFRYALGVGLVLGLAAAMGAEVVVRRVGPWAGSALAALVVVELVALSPVPAPLPTARFVVPAIYEELDTLLPEGALLELPWFEQGTERFRRVRFLNQRVHGRPIPDEVVGFAPRYLRENQFTALLLHIEKNTGMLQVPVTAPERAEADLRRLVDDGLAGIVVDPAAYSQRAWMEIRPFLEANFTRVAERERVVYRAR